MIPDPAVRPRIAIAGASGFIGSALCRALAREADILALTRSPARARAAHADSAIAWRHCDLFALEDLTRALAGCDYAIYLVHSLAPSSRLTQAHPRDLDLILADNFARAAAAQRIKQILYLGALIPSGFRIAPLLWSRREVELVLGSRGTPVTALRAGLVIGPGGSATALLVDLVRRLPLLWLPTAARARLQPLALDDLIRAVRLCLERPEAFRGRFDLGGPETLTYAELFAHTAALLGLRRTILVLPGMPGWLASAIARALGQAPAALVASALESLGEDNLPRPNPLQAAIAEGAIPFRDALRASLDATKARVRPNPRRLDQAEDQVAILLAKRVRSIQRIILPPGQDAAWVAGNYFRWLGACCWPLVRTDLDESGRCVVSFGVKAVRLLVLQQIPERSDAQRQVYAILGGLLNRSGAAPDARFEFHTLLGQRYTMAAIHDYAPALPWPLYRWTQAVLHLGVMRLYQRRLARLAR